ncbi:hypothetical protein ACGFIF_43045 [Kribbella sp. NPDC049174]|uniref:hypothetical protein n=1 Tax=Kribbella sp. NPDC049174 TaxID=3364112 RepID=UPI00371A4BFD
MTNVWAIVIGVLSSLLASGVWLVALRALRPKIEISPVLVEDPGDQPCFRIKVVNRSRRAVVDIAFELVLMRPERTKGGTVKMRKVVRVAGPPPLVLAGSARAKDDNTYRIRVDADLRGLLEQDESRFVRLRVFGRDSLSGLGRVAEREYHEPAADIVTGKYVRGPTFDVI